jgi:hypothetical protein
LPSLAFGDLGVTRVETLEHATFEALQQKLLIQRLAAWGMHFDGHGGLMLRCQSCQSLEPPGTLTCSQCTTALSNAPALGVLIFERNGGYELITTEELGAVLYNAGIRTYAALASTTPEQLLEIVQARSPVPPDVASWIAQARELAATAHE